MTAVAAHSRDTVSFGPFSVVASERLIMKDGVPLALGARSLDILCALLEAPIQPVSKRDLMAKVWPDVTVGDGSLRFHIATLRKALGDGENGARYIATVGGRGYCFVAPVSRSGDDEATQASADDGFLAANVPRRLARMVGRADGVLALSSQLMTSRFVTIVGAGGVGKTTVAVAVGHELIEAFAGAVLFVDLGALSDPNLVAGSVAAMLGLSMTASDATPGLIGYLQDKRVLLILDNCEHLMEAAAALTERIFASAGQVHILATSREALRVEGEHVYRLEPLAFPSEGAGLTALEVLTFPAVQLFVERATASGARLDLNDADAEIVGNICRRLDGVALAIELAAGRVGTYGLHQTAALLEERLSLLWLGQRTAPPRQQTLKATLDWSYGLLSEPERLVLRQLAIFIGSFTLEAARGVLGSTALHENTVLVAIDSLIAKSLVVAHGAATPMRYRLLDTTRAYVLEISADPAEHADLARRHANYYTRWLEHTGAEWPTLANASERALHLGDLANVRSALDWAFGPLGDVAAGIGLAAAAAPVFWVKALRPECHHWSQRAIRALDDLTRGSAEEMHLQAALGMSMMFEHGDAAAAQTALNRSLAIAQDRGDPVKQLQLLVPIHAFLTRTQEFRVALEQARRGVAVADIIGDPAAETLAHTLLGISLHFVGELGEADIELEAGMQRPPSFQPSNPIYLSAGHHLWAGAARARNLWLQGYPARAVQLARRTVTEAASMDVQVGLILEWVFSLFLWVGDLEGAQEHLDRIAGFAEARALTKVEILGFEGLVAVARGDAEDGVPRLQDCLQDLRETRYELLTAFQISLAQGLALLGRFGEALALIEETMAAVEKNGDLAYKPELLRVRGALLLAMPPPRREDAQACFAQSLQLSRDQGARGWELRTATDMAALWASDGRREDARALLQPLLEQFTEGFETADLTAAGHLLATLS